MAIDVNKLIADAKAERAAAAAKQDIADKAAAALSEANKANKAYKQQVQNKLDYANNLQQTINDYEGQLETYAIQISRDGKLNPVDQKDFNRVLSNYEKVSKTYKSTIDEVNTTLAKAPSPTKVETVGGQATIGKTKEQQTVDQIANPNAGTAGSAVTVDSVNKDLDLKIKDAAQFIHDINPAARIGLAKELTAAGIKTGDFKGLENPTLLSNYRMLLNQAKAYNATNKDIKGFTPLDLTGFKSYKKELTAASGGTAGGTTTDTVLFTPERATSYINQEFQTYLNRDATPKEIADLTRKLKIAQEKNPSRTVTDSNGNRVTRQGLDAAGFLDSEIKKLPEYGKKQQSKIIPKTESILATAKANGVLADKNQIDAWNQRIKNGEEAATIQSEIRSMAATGRPDAIAKQLAAGNDLATILSPYKQYMQQILEVPADQIDLNDKTLQMAITGDKPMSLYDYQNALRKDTRWQYTNNAKTAVADSVSTVLKDFGFMG
jgi:hypothetical protein